MGSWLSFSQSVSMVPSNYAGNGAGPVEQWYSTSFVLSQYIYIYI
jgi:hypothetical protein